MLVENVAKGIHQVVDHFTNWYVIEDGDRLGLVDAGIRSSWGTLQEVLGALRRDAGSIDSIVLTHAHVDHIGFAERARTELGIPVFVHEDDEGLAHRPLRYAHERSILPYTLRPKAVPVVLAFLRTRSFLVTPVRGVTTFSDDAVLDVPGSPRVVATPGHTFGHVALHFEDRDVLVVGDALVTSNPYTGETGPRLMPLCSTADAGVALRSLDVIARTIATTLLPGHGDPWRGGAAEAAAQARAIGLS